MAVAIKPIRPGFGAEVSGIDLRTPIEPGEQREVVSAVRRYGLCIYRDTGLTDAGHVAFSRLFGELSRVPPLSFRTGRMSLPELFDAGNLDPDGNIITDVKARVRKRGDRQWHSDNAFLRERASYSLLLAHEVPPEGGSTEFADLRAAYEALPEATKHRIEGLSGVHQIEPLREFLGLAQGSEPARQLDSNKLLTPLVQVHGGSGRRTLGLVNQAMGIAGWPRDAARRLIRELFEFATQPRFVVAVKWAPGDLAVWDNRCTLHRATEFDDIAHRRDLRKTTVREAG